MDGEEDFKMVGKKIEATDGEPRRSGRARKSHLSFQKFFDNGSEDDDDLLNSEDERKAKARRVRRAAGESDSNDEDDGPEVDKMLGLRAAGCDLGNNNGLKSFRKVYLECPSGPCEVLVKWKNKSYLHCEWVHEQRLIELKSTHKAAVKRLKNKMVSGKAFFENEEGGLEYFDQRFLDVDSILAEDTKVESSTRPDIVADLDHFAWLGGRLASMENSDTLMQVISENNGGIGIGKRDLLSPAERKRYSSTSDRLRQRLFIKWCELSYKECTWEYAEDVQDDFKLALFHRINRVPKVKGKDKGYEGQSAAEDLSLWPALATASSSVTTTVEKDEFSSASFPPVPMRFVDNRRARGNPKFPPVLAKCVYQAELVGILPCDEVLAVSGVSMQGEAFQAVSGNISARANAVAQGQADHYTLTIRRFARRFDKADEPIEAIIFTVRMAGGRLGILLESLSNRRNKGGLYEVGRPENVVGPDPIIVGRLLQHNCIHYSPNTPYTAFLANEKLRAVFIGYIVHADAYFHGFSNNTDHAGWLEISTVCKWTGISKENLNWWLLAWPFPAVKEQPLEQAKKSVEIVESALYSFLEHADLVHQLSSFGKLSSERLDHLLSVRAAASFPTPKHEGIECEDGSKSAKRSIARRIRNVLGAIELEQARSLEETKQLGSDAKRRHRQRLLAGEHSSADNHRMHDLIKIAPVLDDIIAQIERENSQACPTTELRDTSSYVEPSAVDFDGHKMDKPETGHVIISRWLKEAMAAAAYDKKMHMQGYLALSEKQAYESQLEAAEKYKSAKELRRFKAERRKRLASQVWTRFTSRFPLSITPFVGEVPQALQRELHRASLVLASKLAGTRAESERVTAIQGINNGFKMQQRYRRRLERTNFVPYTERTQPRYKSGHMLRSYQLLGINWILGKWYEGRNCILADEMGLGKTVQVVATLNHLRTKESVRGPFLIVAPLSTIGHWFREVETWTDMVLCRYYDPGSADAREVIRQHEWYFPNRQGQNDLLKFNVMVTTYETFMQDVEFLRELPWVGVVVDEGHRLKTQKSKLLEMLRYLDNPLKLLLTGTPLQNNISELWSLLNFCDRKIFSDHDSFLERYGDMQTKEQLDDLQAEIAPYMLRRVKEDVEKSIPPKEETIIDVELTMFQKRYYRAIFDKNRTVLYKGCKSGNKPQLINVEMELRKCCNHPYLISGVQDAEELKLTKDIKRRLKAFMKLSPIDKAKFEAAAETNREWVSPTAGAPKPMDRASSEGSLSIQGEDIEEDELMDQVVAGGSVKGMQREMVIERAEFEHLVRNSGKMVLVDKLLPKLRSEGHKVLIFSQFVRTLDLLQHLCHCRGFPVERLDGSVHGNTRQAAIDRFSDPSGNAFVFLLSTRAGGVGINLTAADTVIIYDSDWNPQNDAQAQARCHRIGQKKAVKIFRLVTKNTYEESMLKRAALKLGLERAVLGSVHEANTAEAEVGDAAKKGKRRSMNQGISGRDMSPAELEKMLREGAYHHLQDEDGSAAKAFVGADIDDLLKTNARIVTSSAIQSAEDGEGEVNAQASNVLDRLKHNTVNKSSFTAEVEPGVDVNDPEFWSKVLPDLTSPDGLLSKLNDSTEVATIKKSRESRTAFMSNLRLLIRDIVAQRSAGEIVNEYDLETTYSILVQVSNMRAVFGGDSFKDADRFTRPYAELARLWLQRLETIRERRQRRGGAVDIRRLGLADGDPDDCLFSEPEVDSDDGASGPESRSRRAGKRSKYVEAGTDDEFIAEVDEGAHTSGGEEIGEDEVEQIETLQDDAATDVCGVCADGGELIICEGACGRAFHLKCLDATSRKAAQGDGEWLCADCQQGCHMCLLCGQIGHTIESGKVDPEATPSNIVYKCLRKMCGRFYHLQCVSASQAGKVVDPNTNAFVCPLHQCAKCNGAKFDGPTTVHCLRCYDGYHAACVDHKRSLRLHNNLLICRKHLDGARKIDYVSTHLKHDRNFAIRTRNAARAKERLKVQVQRTSRRGRQIKRPKTVDQSNQELSAKSKRATAAAPKRPATTTVDVVELDWRENMKATQELESSWSGAVVKTCSFCRNVAHIGAPSPDQAIAPSAIASTANLANKDRCVPYPFVQRAGASYHRIWVHEICVLYSPAVFIDEMDQFNNVLKEVRRGRFLPCISCGERGATLGCNLQKCSKSFHVPCAIASGWDPNGTTPFFCNAHRPKPVRIKTARGLAPNGSQKRKTADDSAAQAVPGRVKRVKRVPRLYKDLDI